MTNWEGDIIICLGVFMRALLLVQHFGRARSKNKEIVSVVLDKWPCVAS